MPIRLTRTCFDFEKYNDKVIAVSVNQSFPVYEKDGYVPSETTRMQCTQSAWPLYDAEISIIEKALASPKQNAIIVLAYRTLKQPGYDIEECRKVVDVYILDPIEGIGLSKVTFGRNKKPRTILHLKEASAEVKNRYLGEYLFIKRYEPLRPKFFGDWEKLDSKQKS